MDKGIIFAAGVSYVAVVGAFAIGYHLGLGETKAKEPPKPKEHTNPVKEVKHNYISTEPKRKLSDKIIDKAIDRATQKIIDNAKVDISITF